jgi:hypothetical protein
MRITADAGTVKAGGYRDVPLHPQLVDLGFTDFVNASPDGPLFYRATKGSTPLRLRVWSPAASVSGCRP